jgi:hypothetical protein
MSKLFYVSFLFVATQGLAACGGEPTTTYRSAVSGKECTPNSSLVPPTHGNGGHNSPTGIPGDNMDDLHSGKVDCYYDGNSGQGDDKKHPCAPGCDDQKCCVDEGVDAGTGGGGGGGGGGGEPEVDAGEVPNPG